MNFVENRDERMQIFDFFDLEEKKKLLFSLKNENFETFK